MNDCVTAGLDVGSTATKCVLLNTATGGLLAATDMPTGWAPRQAAESALEAACRKAGLTSPPARLVATGYGRAAIPFATKVVTEITCHGRGVGHLLPEARGVLDIGGQDAKCIALGAGGVVLDFLMNDKCAAGTGRFVQHIAMALGMNYSDFCEAARHGRPVQLSSMCAVFAESEVIGHVARGAAASDLAAGVVRSIALRLKSMLGRVEIRGPVAFTGGLAQDARMVELLARFLETPLITPALPRHAGALGAAILAAT